MSLTETWNEWKEWLMSLSPEFAFLLAIPFAVAAAGLLKYWIDRSGDAPRAAARRGERARRDEQAQA
jgi:hypothetical protein